MEVLITGGSGFIGRALAERLAGRHHVTLLARKGGEGVLQGDVTRPESITGLGPFGVIYHLAAELDESLRYESLYRVNVLGTTNVLRMARGMGARLIYMSTAGVLGPTPIPAKEEDPYNPQTAYEQTKAEAERRVVAFSRDEGLRSIVLRPPIVYGENRHWQKILRAVKRGFPIIGDGENQFHLVYIKNLLQALEKGLETEGCGEVYHIADPRAYTLKQAYAIMAEELGVAPPRHHLPVTVAKGLALLWEAEGRLRHKEPFLSRAYIERLVRERVYDISKAEKGLGYRPEYDFEDGIREVIQGFRARGLL
jgi:nucleoside-diphosphate-sugar epimerase